MILLTAACLLTLTNQKVPTEVKAIPAQRDTFVHISVSNMDAITEAQLCSFFALHHIDAGSNVSVSYTNGISATDYDRYKSELLQEVPRSEFVYYLPDEQGAPKPQMSWVDVSSKLLSVDPKDLPVPGPIRDFLTRVKRAGFRTTSFRYATMPYLDRQVPKLGFQFELRVAEDTFLWTNQIMGDGRLPWDWWPGRNKAEGER